MEYIHTVRSSSSAGFALTHRQASDFHISLFSIFVVLDVIRPWLVSYFAGPTKSQICEAWVFPFHGSDVSLVVFGSAVALTQLPLPCFAGVGPRCLFVPFAFLRLS